jgi:hypothetical protein
MFLRPPINTNEPSSFIVHHALSVDWRHRRRPLIVHANSEPRRNPSLFLYRRSQAQSPHWAWLRPLRRGTSPREALSIIFGGAGATRLLPANRLGPER